ncbi:MAG: TonB-dependent receptor plug domain-containing protein [Terracidiphilus sp.]
MMPKRTIICAGFLLLAAALQVSAQNAPAPAQTQVTIQKPVKGPTETMVVLGSATPVPLAESPRPVEVLTVEPVRLAAETALDVLRNDSAVFLEQRGAGGAQADLVLDGGSFEQALILLNGFRINDAQTSHHNLDLPAPMEAMSQVQVLEGSGSTLHGTDALSGVVDFLTAAPDHDSLRMRLGEGSFESNEESLLAAAARGKWSGRATADRNFSTGFMADRDYRNEDASAENWFGTRLGVTDLLLAGSDRAFGANDFYGPYPSWERTKSWFASARQELGAHTVAAFGYRRHADDFVLFRNDPAIYENNHVDASWQASLRRTQSLRGGALLLMGLESDGDSIRSFNFSGGVTSYALGIHARNRGAGYIDLDWNPPAKRWNLSAGAREEIFSGGAQAVFSPQLAGSLHLNSALKLRASGGYGFRIPTYTDLYYSDPATLGNPNLKPESAWSGNGGADWVATSRVTVSATGFYSRQHDTIDYIRAAAVPNPYLPPSCEINGAQAANTWCAANLNGLHFTGIEGRVTWIPRASQTIHLGWTDLIGSQNPLPGIRSEYALNYPVVNVHASWTAAMKYGVAITNEVAVAHPYQQPGNAPWNANAYPVWNATVTRDQWKLRPYLRLTNLSNTGYQQIVGVPMPPRGIMGGFVVQLGD